MAIVEKYTVEGAVDAGIPTERHYERPEAARLDTQLLDAIEAARKEGREATVRVLTEQLVTHYRSS